MECFQHLLLGSCLVGAMGRSADRSNPFPLTVESVAQEKCSHEIILTSWEHFSRGKVEILFGKGSQTVQYRKDLDTFSGKCILYIEYILYDGGRQWNRYIFRRQKHSRQYLTRSG